MILDPLLDYFRGRAVTIPPMDGALKPNTLLEDSEVLLSLDEPDNLAVHRGEVVFSSGGHVLTLSGGPPLVAFDSPVSAMAASPGGILAIGLDDGRILLDGGPVAAIDGFNCPVAFCFEGESTLYLCNGSDRFRPSQWAHDLMHGNACGSVWRVDLATGSRACLASGLAFPMGAALDGSGNALLVAESWRHRVVAVPLAGGPPRPLLDRLPGYPARIARAPGGYVMALFAPRNRLIEFVLREDAYRADMLREIDSRYWIAPALSPGRSFLEPLQNGSVRTMGIHKPWAPSRSYGLVVALDRSLKPVASYHSRSNGTRHGITSVLARDGALIAAAKGGGAILRIALPAGGQ